MTRKLPKIIYFIVCFLLIFEQSGFAQVAAQLDIAGHLTALHNALTVDKCRPLHLRYISYDNLNNNFKLLLDKGDLKNPRTSELENTSKELLKYFFIGISLPNDTFWVNLRPDSPDNIIDESLAKTDVGKIMLEADLQLKKDTAKFTSPETPEGRDYWNKLYQKAGEIFGSENITIPTLTRPWIVPDEIIIRETTDSAYVYKATLKVMLEQDYLKNDTVYNFKDDRLKQLNEYSSQLIRELIIPKLTKEINVSKRYAPLRQVYYSLILAQWFKARFYGRGGIYSHLINRRDLTNLTSKEYWTKTTYFQAYQKSFKDGEYNLKEPVYTPSGQTIRSYFSGGIANLMAQPQVVQDLARPIGAAANQAVLSAAADQAPNKNDIFGIADANNDVKITTSVSQPTAQNNRNDIIVGAMHEGQEDSVGRLNALRRLLRMKGIDIEEWANQQEANMNDSDRRKLREELFTIGIDDERVGIITDKIVLVDVPEGIRLEDKASRIGGIIIRTKNGYRILLPKDRMLQDLQNKENLGDLLHEVIEMQLIEQGVDVGEAHRRAMEARGGFLGKDRELRKEFDNTVPYDPLRKKGLELARGELLTEEIKDTKIIQAGLVGDSLDKGKVYSALSEQGAQFLIFINPSGNVIASAIYRRYMKYGGVGIKQYCFLPEEFNEDIGGRLSRFLKTDHPEKKENMESRSETLMFTLINIYHDISDFRNEFINNLIIRNLIRHIYRSEKKRGLGQILADVVISVPNKYQAITMGVTTCYSVSLFSSAKYRSRIATMAHELSHVLEESVNPDVLQALQTYFYDRRPSLVKALKNTEDEYKLSDEWETTSELIAYLVMILSLGKTIAFDWGTASESIKQEDIEILIKTGFLPEEFIPASYEKERFIRNGGNIDSEYLNRVYSPARVFSSDNLRENPEDKIIGAMHQATQEDNAINKFEVGRQAESSQNQLSPLDEMFKRKNKKIIFSIPQESGQKYQIGIQEDFVDRGLFQFEGDKPKYMVYASTIPKNRGEVSYPVVMATGLDMESEGVMHWGWLVVLDYPSILEKIEEFRRTQQKETLIEAMALYIVFGQDREIKSQVKLLYGYITSVLDIKTDEDVRAFFTHAPSNLRNQGIGNALAEFVTSFVPIGERIRFILANQVSLDELETGKAFGDTLIGKWFRNLGFKVAEEVKSAEDKRPEYALEKEKNPIARTTWDNPQDLGRNIVLSDNTESVTKPKAPNDSDNPPSLPPAPSGTKSPGGIDFRTLPIVTQAISNLGLNVSRIPLTRLDSINLNQEWQEIQKMVDAGITPSAERIKEYVQVSCLKGNQDLQKVVSCIADILRLEEERCCSTEATLKDILVVLESGRSTQELKAVFTGNPS